MARQNYARPTPQARAYTIPGTRQDGKRYGKLAPRQCDPAVMGAASNRYERRCLRCDRPLESWEHPVCCSREELR
jgi:hypothetical protein